jgi:hypothetical protein
MSKIVLVIIFFLLFVTTTTFQHITPVDTAKRTLKFEAKQELYCPALDSAEANLQVLKQRQDSVSTKIDILKALLSKDIKLTPEQKQQVARILKK